MPTLKVADCGEGCSVNGSGATNKQKEPSTGVGTGYQFITARQLQAQAKQMQEARKMVKKNNEEASLGGFLGSGSNQAT
ncbi:hypothetical protein SLEP1_g12121 [Rubroshorea leprosula]|nr:hypothetical protein SLEP1_g12121 [Rubroshorea leprosula]